MILGSRDSTTTALAANRPVHEDPSSVLVRPVGHGALLLCALGLLSWCAMLAG